MTDRNDFPTEETRNPDEIIVRDTETIWQLLLLNWDIILLFQRRDKHKFIFTISLDNESLFTLL